MIPRSFLDVSVDATSPYIMNKFGDTYDNSVGFANFKFKKPHEKKFIKTKRTYKGSLAPKKSD